MKDLSEQKTVAVIGGDLRMYEAALAFSQKGHRVKVYGLDILGDRSAESLEKASDLKDALALADCVLLPLPYSYDGEKLNAPLSRRVITLKECFAHLSRRQNLAAGLLGATLPEGFSAFDYTESETFAIKNARATVEGALAIAIRESAVTLCSSRAVITGYGRIGKLLARSLTALGSHVTIIARSAKDRAFAWSDGMEAAGFSALPNAVKTADFIFNTVPSEVIGRKVLQEVNKKTLLIELASLPGGIDAKAAFDLSLPLVSALGLPGKYSPKTAGQIIADCIGEAFGL